MALVTVSVRLHSLRVMPGPPITVYCTGTVEGVPFYNIGVPKSEIDAVLGIQAKALVIATYCAQRYADSNQTQLALQTLLGTINGDIDLSKPGKGV